MTSTSTTEHERDDQWQARTSAAIAAAQAAIVEARAAETEAFELVDRARAEKGLGSSHGSPSAVIKAQRFLARAQETTATAEAVARKVRKDIDAEFDVRERAGIAAARAEQRAYASTRAESLALASQLFDSIRAAMDAIDALEAVPPLNTYRGDYERLVDALNRLQSRY